MINDNSIMPFGKHKGEKMANVPDGWLLWFWGENKQAYEKDGGLALSTEQKEIMEYIYSCFEDKDL